MSGPPSVSLMDQALVLCLATSGFKFVHHIFYYSIILLLFHYYSTTILLFYYILLSQAVCCPVAVLSNVWLLVIGYDEQPGARNIPCASLILARHIVAQVYGISMIFIFIFRSLIVLYADTGLER